jgi:hypothetical protein
VVQPGIRYHFFLLTGQSFIERAVQDGAHEAAGQLSGESRREGSSQDTRRVSGGLEGVRQPVLHHQSNGRISAHLSDESLVGNRRQTGEGVFAESRQAKIFDGQGRVLVPAVLRESAQMKGEVDVFGNLDHLEVMNHTRIVDSLKNEPYTSEDDKALEDLGI